MFEFGKTYFQRFERIFHIIGFRKGDGQDERTIIRQDVSKASVLVTTSFNDAAESEFPSDRRDTQHIVPVARFEYQR